MKERVEKAQKTKILTADNIGLSNWDDTVKAFSKLASDVRSFNIAHNKLKGSIPRSFVQIPCILQSVRILDLQSNQIDDISVFCIDLQSQEHLPADELDSALQNALVTFPSLPTEQINLSGNKIQRLSSFCFFRFPHLKQLNLSHNSIKSNSIGPRTFVGTPNLLSLNLSHNHLAMFPLSDPQVKAGSLISAYLPKLVEINLVGNNLVSINSNSAPLSSVKTLDISNQKSPDSLACIDASIFSDCPKLTNLVVDGANNKQKIFDALREDDRYQKWMEARASDIDRQIASGLRANLAN